MCSAVMVLLVSKQDVDGNLDGPAPLPPFRDGPRAPAVVTRGGTSEGSIPTSCKQDIVHKAKVGGALRKVGAV